MFLFVHVDRNASAVVDDCYRIIFVDRHVNVVGIACEGFVNGVVHHLIDQMVQTLLADIAYIHGWALSYSLQSFEHLYITCAVFFFFFCHY